MTDEQLAKTIIVQVGSRSNIAAANNCMTRLRLTLNDYTKANTSDLKNLPGVLGVNQSDTELQIILGPSKAAKITTILKNLLSADSVTDKATALHKQIKEKNATPIKLFFKHIADIFIPLIPAFIACGIINGFLNVIQQIQPVLSDSTAIKLFSIMGQAIFTVLNIFVGLNAAKEFGGTPVLSGLLAAFMTTPELANINLMDSSLVPGRGGIFAILMISAFASFIEIRLHKLMPQITDFFLTPLLTFIISSLLAVLIFQPLGGIISTAIGNTAYSLISGGGAVTGFFMAGSFLPMVMMGLHQVLTPIHAELIVKTGETILLPILAMAGAGQVGAAIAVLLKTKNTLLKKTIITSLPVAFLGVGEPLIYGVTLPLFRPFVAACIGAAFGGALEAYYIVGANTIGISGLPLAAAVDKPLIYISGLVISYIAGFIATVIIGFDDPNDK